MVRMVNVPVITYAVVPGVYCSSHDSAENRTGSGFIEGAANELLRPIRER